MGCQRFVDYFADEARDARTIRGRDAHTVRRVVFGVCSHQSHEPYEIRVIKVNDLPVRVRADIEFNPVVADDACIAVNGLYVG